MNTDHFHLFGWTLLIIAAILYIVANVGDLVPLIGSVAFLVGSLLLLLPHARGSSSGSVL